MSGSRERGLIADVCRMPYYEIDDDDDDLYGVGLRTPSHSGWGVASFVLASLNVCFVFGLLMMLGLEVKERQGLDEQASTTFMGCLILGELVSLIGIGLGIAGCCQKHRKKIFAILGVVFNSVIVVCGGLFMLLVELLKM